jgi:RNA polymerase sigma factor (sigma-70 family)
VRSQEAGSSGDDAGLHRGENTCGWGTRSWFGVVGGVEVSFRPPDPARAAADLLARHRAALWRTARRFSICADDADDALQRASLILLLKGPPLEPNRLIAWMSVVVKHEALGVRRTRERLLGPSVGDALAALESELPGPAEIAERRERIAAARRRLSELKANERLALLLQAEGYSYAEICARCGWTYTKVNRCLAEGRAQLRQLGTLA